MFTGLVEMMAEVARLIPDGPGVQLAIREPRLASSAKQGDSMAINGCCLTVVAASQGLVEFQAGAETLSRTNLGEIAAGDLVNIERPLKIGDDFGGHFVTGHIDAVGTVAERRDDAEWSAMWFRARPPPCGRWPAKVRSRSTA